MGSQVLVAPLQPFPAPPSRPTPSVRLALSTRASRSPQTLLARATIAVCMLAGASSTLQGGLQRASRVVAAPKAVVGGHLAARAGSPAAAFCSGGRAQAGRQQAAGVNVRPPSLHGKLMTPERAH